MNEKYFPSLILDSVTDITADILKENNIKGLILDIDNTLVPNHVTEADETLLEWIEKMKYAGIKISIVSNASKKRVHTFNNKLNLYAVHRAFKPSVRAFNKASRLMGLDNKNVAVVGDQIFTDIVGGNSAGMFTILVKPIDKREEWFVRLKRKFEKRILRQYAERLKREDK